MLLVENLATRAATTIDRRRFLRRLAEGSFIAVATVAAGGGLDVLRASVAWAVDETCCAGQPNVGDGCPNTSTSGYPCGPSRCCSYTSGHTGCNCSKSGAGCKTQSENANCFGPDSRHYSQSTCWSCRGPCYRCSTDPPIQCRKITTCCDCKTDASACNDNDLGSGYGRCVSYNIQVVQNPSGCTVSPNC
jgi:hypothetical protein